MRKWVRVAAYVAAVVPTAAVLHPGMQLTPSAQAATATLSGVLRQAPKWESVTESGSSLCPCGEIDYPLSGWLGQPSIAYGVEALDEWIASSAPGDTVLAYSKGTHAALGWIRDNVGDPLTEQVRMVLLGAPETPGNPFRSIGHRNQNGLPATGDYGNVTFVVRQYDRTADYPADWWNFLAVANAVTSTHLFGYDDVDLDAPMPSTSTPRPGPGPSTTAPTCCPFCPGWSGSPRTKRWHGSMPSCVR